MALGLCLLIPVCISAVLVFIPIGVQSDNKILLASGQTITPAGDQIETNDRPMGIAMSPDGIHAAVLTGSNTARRWLPVTFRPL